MPHSLLIVSQLDYLIQIVDINSHMEWQTVQIQISWLLKNLHCLQRQGISGFSRTRVNPIVVYNFACHLIPRRWTGHHTDWRLLPQPVSEGWSLSVAGPIMVSLVVFFHWACYFISLLLICVSLMNPTWTEHIFVILSWHRFNLCHAE